MPSSHARSPRRMDSLSAISSIQQRGADEFHEFVRAGRRDSEAPVLLPQHHAVRRQPVERFAQRTVADRVLLFERLQSQLFARLQASVDDVVQQPLIYQRGEGCTPRGRLNCRVGHDCSPASAFAAVFRRNQLRGEIIGKTPPGFVWREYTRAGGGSKAAGPAPAGRGCFYLVDISFEFPFIDGLSMVPQRRDKRRRRRYTGADARHPG